MDWDIPDEPAGVASPASPKIGEDDTAPALRRDRRDNRRNAEYMVVTDLPDLLTVSEAELKLLERELSGFIAALLK